MKKNVIFFCIGLVVSFIGTSIYKEVTFGKLLFERGINYYPDSTLCEWGLSSCKMMYVDETPQDMKNNYLGVPKDNSNLYSADELVRMRVSKDYGYLNGKFFIIK